MNIELIMMIVIPIVTSVVFVAYMHPKAYSKRIAPAISTIGLVIVFISYAYNLGVFRAETAVKAFDRTKKFAERDPSYGQAADAVYISEIFLVGIGIAILLAVVLTQLPKWLDMDTESDADD